MKTAVPYLDLLTRLLLVKEDRSSMGLLTAWVGLWRFLPTLFAEDQTTFKVLCATEVVRMEVGCSLAYSVSQQFIHLL